MKKTVLILLCVLLLFSVTAQDYKVLQFVLNPDEVLLNQPVSIDLSGVDYYKDSTYIELSLVDGKKRIPVPSQLEKGSHDRLWFIPGRTIKKDENVIFEIHRISGEKKSTGVSAMKNDENIHLLSNGSEILSYRHALTDVPAGD